MVTVADADKQEEWESLQPFLLTPDFEGVDPDALAEAARDLWGDYIVAINADRVREIMKATTLNGGTVRRLRTYFRSVTRSFSFPDENGMKKQLRHTLSTIWIRRRKMPQEVEAPVLQVLEQAFGLRSPVNPAA